MNPNADSTLPRLVLSDDRELQFTTDKTIIITGVPRWTMLMMAGEQGAPSSVAAAYVPLRTFRNERGISYALPGQLTCAYPATPASIALHPIALALATELNVTFRFPDPTNA